MRIWTTALSGYSRVKVKNKNCRDIIETSYDHSNRLATVRAIWNWHFKVSARVTLLCYRQLLCEKFWPFDNIQSTENFNWHFPTIYIAIGILLACLHNEINWKEIAKIQSNENSNWKIAAQCKHELLKYHAVLDCKVRNSLSEIYAHNLQPVLLSTLSLACVRVQFTPNWTIKQTIKQMFKQMLPHQGDSIFKNFVLFLFPASQSSYLVSKNNFWY